jgi:signal transduction histidine kinase
MARLSNLGPWLAVRSRRLPGLLRRPWLACAGTALVFIIGLAIRAGCTQTTFSLYLCLSLVGGYYGGLGRGLLVTGLGALGLLLGGQLAPRAGQNTFDDFLTTVTFLLIGGLVSYLCDQGRRGLRELRDLARTLDSSKEQVAAADAAAAQATAELARERTQAQAQRRAHAEAEAAAQARLVELEAVAQALREQGAAERESSHRELAGAREANDELRGLAVTHEAAIQRANAELAEIERQQQELAAELARREEALRSRLAELQAQADERETALAQLRQAHDQRQRELAAALGQVESTREAQRQADQRLQELQSARDTDQAARQQTERQLRELQAVAEQERGRHQKASTELRREVEEACAGRDRLQQELTQATTALNGQKERNEAQGKQLTSLQEQQAEWLKRSAEADTAQAVLRGRMRELEDELRLRSNDRGLLAWLMDAGPGVARARSAAATMSGAVPVESPWHTFARSVDDDLSPVLHAFNTAALAQRLRQGQVQAERQPIALPALVRRVVDAVERTVQARGQHLTVQLALEPHGLLGDIDLLTHALTELLNNAIRHAGAGANIQLAVVRRGDELTFEVQDDGAGVPPALAAALPDLSARANRFWTGAEGALGLGLAVARDVAHLHQGRLAVCTEPATQFILSLPALPVQPVGEPPPLNAVAHGAPEANPGIEIRAPKQIPSM